MFKYSQAIIFTKHTNMLSFFHANVNQFDSRFHGEMYASIEYKRMEEYYAKERDVELILLVRYDGNKTLCRIKCPINPMPVKGEFEAASLSAMISFLVSNGWSVKEKLSPRMFE